MTIYYHIIFICYHLALYSSCITFCANKFLNIGINGFDVAEDSVGFQSVNSAPTYLLSDPKASFEGTLVYFYASNVVLTLIACRHSRVQTV